MKDLEGKTAFVSGGSSGIGLGIVKVLAAAGMKVAFSYRRQDHLDQAMAFFRDKPGQLVHPVKLDVTDRAALAATHDDWDWIMSVNVASMGGIAALGSVGLYTTTKYAVVGLSESLRTDMIGRNVGVSVYCPGTVKSNIGEGGMMRDERLKNTGYAPSEAPKDGEPSFMALAMDAVEAGGHVLRGIRENQLFIISHPEYREVLRARHAKIEASITREPVDEVRAASVRWILSNDIYSRDA